MNTNRQWLLAKRPFGRGDRRKLRVSGSRRFRNRADGQVLVRNLYLSFDPTQRGWMEDRESYMAPVAHR